MAEYQNFKPNTFYADSMVSKVVDDYSNIYFQFKLYFSTDSVPTGFSLVLNDAETLWEGMKNHLWAIS